MPYGQCFVGLTSLQNTQAMYIFEQQIRPPNALVYRQKGGEKSHCNDQ